MLDPAPRRCPSHSGASPLRLSPLLRPLPPQSPPSDAEDPRLGSVVTFVPYVDQQGLGAEEPWLAPRWNRGTGGCRAPRVPAVVRRAGPQHAPAPSRRSGRSCLLASGGAQRDSFRTLVNGKLIPSRCGAPCST